MVRWTCLLAKVRRQAGSKSSSGNRVGVRPAYLCKYAGRFPPSVLSLAKCRAFFIVMETPYFAYAIYSKSRNYIYVGISNDVKRRLNEHNLGYNKTTKPYRPFELIYQEKLDTREEARKREKYLKGGSGRKFLRKLIEEG